MKTIITNDLIGTYAGIVWRTLNSCSGELTLEELTKKAELSEQQTLLGIGWLARENKINFCDIDGTTRIYLTHLDFYF